MTPMRVLRANPHFARLFARVHPLCWPILWWSLNRLLDWYETSGYAEVLYATSRWGVIRIVYYGDRLPDPSAPRPYVLTRPRWDDPVWNTSVPAPLLARAVSDTVRPGALQACGGDGSWLSLRPRARTAGSSALSSPDTS